MGPGQCDGPRTGDFSGYGWVMGSGPVHRPRMGDGSSQVMGDGSRRSDGSGNS